MTANADLVRESFKNVSPQAGAMAERFYSSLFKRAPELLPLFDHTDWAKQRYILVASLHYMAFNLDNPNALRRSLQQMGARHLDYGVKPEDFTVFGECLVEAIAHFSGPSWNDALQQAWTEAYDKIRRMMTDREAHPATAYRPR